MSDVKDLLLIIFFLFFVFKYITLYKELLKQRQQFIQTLNHDLRVSSIAQIRGLEVLQKNVPLEASCQNLITEIKESCEYSFDMITTLLNTYRFEGGEQILSYETFDINRVIEQSCIKCEEAASLKQIKISSFPNSINYVEADKSAITKLLFILFSTAIFYASPKSAINISIKKTIGKIKISLIYKGNPLTEEECKRMFLNNSRFSTVGQGIRMYFCKKIIDFHKGIIKVENLGNGYNSFTFTLPIKKTKKRFRFEELSLLQPYKL